MNNKKATLAIIGIILLLIPNLLYLITSVMEFSDKVVVGSSGIFSFKAWKVIILVNNIFSFLGFAFLLAYFSGSSSKKGKPQAPVMPQQYQQPVQQQYQQPAQQQYQQPAQQPAQQQYQQPAQQQYQQPTNSSFQPSI